MLFAPVTKIGRPGSAEPVSGVVRLPGLDGQGGPGDEYSPTRIGSDDLIYSVVHVNCVNNVVHVSGPEVW